MNQYPHRAIYTLATLFAIWFAAAAHPQTATSAAEHFPYAFSNFAWWTDADLRSELNRRIPGLGDDLTRNSANENKIRTTLIQLLKAKGIDANVQIHEPDSDYASQKRVPQAPPVSIVFSVASPLILIDTISLDGAPSDASDNLQKAAAIRNGTQYSTQNFWSVEDLLKEPLSQGGYLTGKIVIKPGTPSKDGNDFKVPLVAFVTAGPKFHVAGIKANGGPLLAGRDLTSYFSVKPGDVAQPNPFGRLAGAIRSTYWHAGYPDVEMHGEPVLDIEHGLASYDLEVVPGPLYHLRSLTILHLDDAQQVTVKPLLGIRTGDVYDGMATAKLSQSLRNTPSLLPGYDFGYSAKEDKTAHVVDLTLDFFKRQ